MTTWNWQLLKAGAFRLDGGSMFGVVPKSIWSKLVEPDDHNRIPLQTNCLLLDNGSQKVIIETGFGDKWSDKERGFFELQRRTIVDALKEINVDPADIDYVIVTHLHFDHAAGLTTLDQSGEPVSNFPNATIISQQTEWTDALANKSTMTRTYLRSHLDPVSSQIKLIDGEDEVVDGLSVFPMLGHTWGQQAVRFNDREGMVCFPGDVMPTRNHVGLAYSMGYDQLPYENMQSKKKLLMRAAENNWRLVLDHEPDQPVVRVGNDPERSGRFITVPAD